MQGRLEVLDVATPGAAPGIAYFSIDKPSPGTGAGMAGDQWALDVRGSAVGSERPVVRVEFESAGRLIHSAASDAPRPALAQERPELGGAGTSGYYATLGALDLPQEFDVSVHAVLEGGARIPVGRIAGRRAALATSFEPRLRPLMVTGPGRSGSTIFMQMLAGHPDIVAWPPFDEEARVASYWIEVLRALARPDSFMRQVAPAGNLNGDWWLGRRDPRPRALSDGELQAWLGAEAVEDLAAFAQSRIDELYMRLAARTGREGAAFFAEKLRNDIVSDLAWEMYPDAREVVLVRDPRDVLCSILASNRKRGERPPPEDTLAWIGGEFHARIASVAESRRRRGQQAHLVRYEDLMTNAGETVRGVLEYAGIDASDAAIAQMLAHGEQALPQMERHRTTPDPAASIGRWTRELEPALAEECERVLGDALEALGYEAAATARP